jgi:hypothetical protein
VDSLNILVTITFNVVLMVDIQVRTTRNWYTTTATTGSKSISF